MLGYRWQKQMKEIIQKNPVFEYVIFKHFQYKKGMIKEKVILFLNQTLSDSIVMFTLKCYLLQPEGLMSSCSPAGPLGTAWIQFLKLFLLITAAVV